MLTFFSVTFSVVPGMRGLQYLQITAAVFIHCVLCKQIYHTYFLSHKNKQYIVYIYALVFIGVDITGNNIYLFFFLGETNKKQKGIYLFPVYQPF